MIRPERGEGERKRETEREGESVKTEKTGERREEKSEENGADIQEGTERRGYQRAEKGRIVDHNPPTLPATKRTSPGYRAMANNPSNPPIH